MFQQKLTTKSTNLVTTIIYYIRNEKMNRPMLKMKINFAVIKKKPSQTAIQ